MKWDLSGVPVYILGIRTTKNIESFFLPLHSYINTDWLNWRMRMEFVLYHWKEGLAGKDSALNRNSVLIRKLVGFAEYNGA